MREIIKNCFTYESCHIIPCRFGEELHGFKAMAGRMAIREHIIIHVKTKDEAECVARANSSGKGRMMTMGPEGVFIHADRTHVPYAYDMMPAPGMYIDGLCNDMELFRRIAETGCRDVVAGGFTSPDTYKALCGEAGICPGLWGCTVPDGTLYPPQAWVLYRCSAIRDDMYRQDMCPGLIAVQKPQNIDEIIKAYALGANYVMLDMEDIIGLYHVNVRTGHTGSVMASGHADADKCKPELNEAVTDKITDFLDRYIDMLTGRVQEAVRICGFNDLTEMCGQCDVALTNI